MPYALQVLDREDLPFGAVFFHVAEEFVSRSTESRSALALDGFHPESGIASFKLRHRCIGRDTSHGCRRRQGSGERRSEEANHD